MDYNHMLMLDYVVQPNILLDKGFMIIVIIIKF